MLVHGLLYHFEGPLEGKKLQPFLNKRYIEIPQSSEQTYFEKFVAPLIEKHHVYDEGFEIITERHNAVPVLKISGNSIGSGAILHFRYNTFLFPFSTNPVSVKVHRHNGSYKFYRIKRSRTWEQKMASELTEMGMKQQDALFTLEGTDFYGLVHWLNENTSRLQEKGFLIEQESGGREIVIGKSHINLEFRENNDWFDIRSEEHTSELQSLMRISYAASFLKKTIHMIKTSYKQM